MSLVSFEFLRKRHTLFFIMTLPKPYQDSLFLHPYRHLLDFNTLVSVGVLSFGFMCIVFDIKGKLLFINLLANCTNIFEKWLFKSLAHFKSRCCFMLLLLSCDFFMCFGPWLHAWFINFLPFHIGTTFPHRCVYVMCGHVYTFSHVCKYMCVFIRVSVSHWMQLFSYMKL